jgi:DNA-binding NarL/FixJ family response regulator
MTVRVLLADDQELIRSGLGMIIDDQADMTIVGMAEDGGQAIELATTTSPDVVLMDIRMPRMDGIEATERLTASANPPRIVILTTFDLDEYVYNALSAGASGFLLKDAPPAELVNAIRVVAAGEALLAPSATRRLIEQFARARNAAVAARGLETISERELEVLRLVAQGRSNAEIADSLIVGLSTVKTHVGRLLEKLQLRDRVQLAVYSYESGVVRPGELKRQESVEVSEPDRDPQRLD